MLVRELNQKQCKTYLVGCERTQRAALIDPLREHARQYLTLLAELGYTLDYAIDTHTHADHRSAVLDLKSPTNAKAVMHRLAPTPSIDNHVDDGQILELGDVQLQVLATPGHTPDSMCLYSPGYVFTGDTLLIRGTGRTDFAGGDAGVQYDSITRKLFTLPDDTVVLPAHDYRGNTQSTIGEEKRLNPRIAGRSKVQYTELMANLGLPLPDNIQEVLQANESALDDTAIAFPNAAQLNQVQQLEPAAVAALASSQTPPLLLDVREAIEYTGELGHVRDSVLIPLKELTARANEWQDWKHKQVIAICRAGVRSTTAAAILVSLGFERVSNMKGGMLAWNDQRLPVNR